MKEDWKHVLSFLSSSDSASDMVQAWSCASPLILRAETSKAPRKLEESYRYLVPAAKEIGSQTQPQGRAEVHMCELLGCYPGFGHSAFQEALQMKLRCSDHPPCD